MHNFDNCFPFILNQRQTLSFLLELTFLLQVFDPLSVAALFTLGCRALLAKGRPVAKVLASLAPFDILSIRFERGGDLI